MVDPETIRRRLRRLDEWVQRLRDLGTRPRKEFLQDPIAQAAAERLLQVSIQIVLDIGAHILSDRGVVDWEEYREVPQRLARLGVLPDALADRLASAAGQRNVLVHMYLEVNPERIHETLQRDLDAFAEFAAHVLRLIEE
ncbi:MAG: type VII toxin-antitoxin system HepT family RNase toxin [Gemmatimonadota bacterium]